MYKRQCLASLLAELLPRGPVLTAGIGNRAMTCDAIGPTAVDHLLVTRPLVRSGQEPFRGLRELSALCTDCLLYTSSAVPNLRGG